MLLPLAGVLLVGLPSLLLALWFGWLLHQRFLRGGFLLVARTQAVVFSSIAATLTIASLPVADTSHRLLNCALVVVCVVAIAGGVPSAVIALDV